MEDERYGSLVHAKKTQRPTLLLYGYITVVQNDGEEYSEERDRLGQQERVCHTPVPMHLEISPASSALFSGPEVLDFNER